MSASDVGACVRGSRHMRVPASGTSGNATGSTRGFLRSLLELTVPNLTSGLDIRDKGDRWPEPLSVEPALRQDLFDRCGVSVIESLVQLKAEFYAGSGFAFSFHAFRQGQDPQLPHHLHEIGDHSPSLG